MSNERESGDNRQLPEQAEEFSRMEKWLDEHPEFVHDYFARKAQKSMVEGWLISDALTRSPGLNMHSDTNSSGSNSKNNSGTNTPVRKISAQEFDRGETLNPILSTVDGTPTFLGPSPTSSQGGLNNNTMKSHRRSRSELKALDEKELMYELVIDICNDLDVTSLCHKILQNVCVLLNADRCSLFLVQGRGSEEKYLISKLFDVSADTTLEEVSVNREDIKICLGVGIVGYVAKTGETQNIPDAYEDPRFNNEVDLKMGYKTRSILSMPIKDMYGTVIGVAQAINKDNTQAEPFNEHDEKVFASYLAFCGIGLKNAQLYEKSLLENRRNQVLLDLARAIFEEQSNVANLIYKIMMHTQSLLQCQRCQVMLIDDLSKDKNKKLNLKKSMGIFSQVFDLEDTDFDNSDTYNREWPAEPRFPLHIGISGYVATTGEILNIPDAYTDKRFSSKSDEETGFKTKSILCMPIKNSSNKVIGVAQLVNKLDDDSVFNKNDEYLFEAFAIFCGMGINNTQMYETAVRAMAKQRIALECLSYHATVSAEEGQRLKIMPVPTSLEFNLLDYTFNDFGLDDDDTLKASIRMFLDLNFLERFRINYGVLCRWLMSVKKNYRNVTYHNWRHAFNVAQTMFCMLKKGDLNVFTDTEKLALMVGCLCHDLDHRGTNNQFQILSESPLADLYSTSTLEHHHFDQCIMILTTKGNDILSNIKQNEYEEVIQLLEGAILATDLALYFKHRGKFFNMVKNREADWRRREDRDLLRSMMMTASDISAITKPWDVQEKVADLIAAEFFEQGDIEKKQLKIKPQDMMNRDLKHKLPDMQVNFIDVICMPVYEAMSQVSTSLSPLYEGCKRNRDNWGNISSTTSEAEKKDEKEKATTS